MSDDLQPETADLIGAFEEMPYPFWRTAGEDSMRLGKRRNHVPMLLEVDVTVARAALAKRKQEDGGVSFTAWATTCIAQAASQFPRVHAVRGRRPLAVPRLTGHFERHADRWPRGVVELAGRLEGLARSLPLGPRTIVTFSDVDVCIAVYRRLSGDEAGERVPMPFVIRKVNEKSPQELTEKIRAAQSRPLPDDQQWLDPLADVPPPSLVRLGFAAPAWLRDLLYWDRLLGDPFAVKRTMGTVMVTSLPLNASGGAWGIPAGLHPLIVALGAVAWRPGLAQAAEARGRDGSSASPRLEPREFLSMTVLFDHDVVDGLPVALFLRRLSELMEQATGL